MNVGNMLLPAIIAATSFVVDLAADEPKPGGQSVGLAVGDQVPLFENFDDQGQTWKLQDHVGKKVLVLYFYPGDFNSGCIRQAEAYREGMAKIEALDVELVGVSGDEVATHRLFKETFGLKHALLADPKGELAALLGVPIRGGAGKVRAIGVDHKPLLDDAGNPIVLDRPATMRRWTLVIDREGKLASTRNILDPVSDTEEVLKIVASLPNEKDAADAAPPRNTLNFQPICQNKDRELAAAGRLLFGAGKVWEAPTTSHGTQTAPSNSSASPQVTMSLMVSGPSAER